jgi:protoporphyrin/coproporphyrin ferrochelatase
MTRPKHIAVVLFNLGGPDSRAAIKPFLLNFFNDPNIISAPQPIRGLIAWLIARKRTRAEAGDSYAMLGNKSPLLENSNLQARALESALNQNGEATKFTVHVCMNYWHPMSDQVVRNVRDQNPDQIVLLPLYPQFSTTTTWSSLQSWQRACTKHHLQVPTALICCYPADTGFIGASVDLVRETYMNLKQSLPTGVRAPRVLFSAHGLPEKIIRGGDPYQAQCETTAAKIAAALNIPDLDWQICYQSRVGPLKWIGPSTDEALHQAAADQVPVCVYPCAFVSEHVETLVEIEHEYRDLATKLGVPGFARVPTVMTHPKFIAGLADLVRSRIGIPGVASNTGQSICPTNATRCCMRMNVTGLDQPEKGCCHAH